MRLHAAMSPPPHSGIPVRVGLSSILPGFGMQFDLLSEAGEFSSPSTLLEKIAKFD